MTTKKSTMLPDDDRYENEDSDRDFGLSLVLVGIMLVSILLVLWASP